LAESAALRAEHSYYDSGQVYTSRYGSLGTRMGAAFVGGVAGNAILPGFGLGAGAIIGGFAGGAAGGYAGSFLFPENGASVTNMVTDAIEKQEKGMVKETDVLQIVGRAVSPREQAIIEKSVASGNIFGLGYLVEDKLYNVLPPDFYEGHTGEDALQYVTRMCNEGKLDVAQLVRDPEYMQLLPPRQHRGVQDDVCHAHSDVMYDSAYDGEMPGSAPGIPHDAGRGGHRMG
jgi:hypothetical protein